MADSTKVEIEALTSSMVRNSFFKIQVKQSADFVYTSLAYDPLKHQLLKKRQSLNPGMLRYFIQTGSKLQIEFPFPNLVTSSGEYDKKHRLSSNTDMKKKV